MKNYSLHVCQVSNGYEVCVFDEDLEIIDFDISRDNFLNLFEALNYANEITSCENYIISNIIYDLPIDFSPLLEAENYCL